MSHRTACGWSQVCIESGPVRPCTFCSDPQHGILIQYTARDSHQLDKVQRRAARFVKRDYRRTTSVSELTSQLGGWQSLEERRKNARLSLFYKGLHGLAAVPVHTAKELRNTAKDPRNIAKGLQRTAKELRNTAKDLRNTAKDPRNVAKGPQRTTKDLRNTAKDPRNVAKGPQRTTKDRKGAPKHRRTQETL